MNGFSNVVFILIFSFMAPLPKVCGPLWAKGNSRSPLNVLSNTLILLSNELARLQYSQGSFPNPGFLGDYRMPTNVMVSLPSGMAGRGLGDGQAAPSVRRNGWQGAGISLQLLRIICKEPPVLSQ